MLARILALFFIEAVPFGYPSSTDDGVVFYATQDFWICHDLSLPASIRARSVTTTAHVLEALIGLLILLLSVLR